MVSLSRNVFLFALQVSLVLTNLSKSTLAHEDFPVEKERGLVSYISGLFSEGIEKVKYLRSGLQQERKTRHTRRTYNRYHCSSYTYNYGFGYGYYDDHYYSGDYGGYYDDYYYYGGYNDDYYYYGGYYDDYYYKGYYDDYYHGSRKNPITSGLEDRTDLVKIYSKMPGYCMDWTSCGSFITISKCSKSLSQLWSMDALGGISPFLEDEIPLCVDPEGTHAFPGVKLEVRACIEGDLNQKFSFNPVDGTISSQQNPGLCVDIPNDKRDKKLQLWDCNGMDDKVWIFDPLIFPE